MRRRFFFTYKGIKEHYRIGPEGAPITSGEGRETDFTGKSTSTQAEGKERNRLTYPETGRNKKAVFSRVPSTIENTAL